MQNDHKPIHGFSYLISFLMGFILFLSFGKDWLNLESDVAFFAGLIGIAFALMLVRAWDLYRHSHHDKR